MPESNLKQGWRHNQKKNISETNFKAMSCKQQLKKRLLDPFKVHPGLQHPEGPGLKHLQQWDAARHDKSEGVHAEREEKKWREGENKRISQKLRCASCGDIHVASPCTQETWTLSHPPPPHPKNLKNARPLRGAHT